MTYRAGSWDANWRVPDFRGVIRRNGTAWYTCTHRDQHMSTRSARACAQAALPLIRQQPGWDDPDGANTITLPEGWEIFRARE